MRIAKKCLLAAMALCLMVFGIVPVSAADDAQTAKSDGTLQSEQENIQLTDLAGLLSQQEAEDIGLQSWSRAPAGT